MVIVLFLLVSALLCFAFFYKAMDWFEHIESHANASVFRHSAGFGVLVPNVRNYPLGNRSGGRYLLRYVLTFSHLLGAINDDFLFY